MKNMRFSLSAVTLLLSAASSAANPVFVDGYKFTWKSTVESDTRQPGGAAPSMAVQLAGGKLRLDFLESSENPMMKKGGYMIMDAENNKLIMVSPEEKKAMVMDPTAMGSMVGAMGGSGLVKMDMDNVKVDVEDLGDGERMLGKATHKYRVTRSYDMSVKVVMMKRNSHHQSVSETWLTNDFGTDRAFEAFGRQFANRVAAGGSMQKLMEAEKKVPRGFPMKTVMQSTDTDDKGKATTTSTTMEVTELTKANIDPSVFEVPSGYETVDMGAEMKDARIKMDSAKADCENDKGKGNCEMPNADSLAKEGAKASTKDAAKKGLKGLFKKP
ncbi:MAG: DUF4412 domain-containing protein [Gemmatimonadaceae bacterium]